MTLSIRLGLHLAPDRVRAVRFAPRGRGCDVFEADWSPDDPLPVARAIKEQLGGAGAVSLAVDIGFTFVKRVNLPPLQIDERRRILELEPERYFPVRGERLIVSLSDGNNLAFAVRERQLESWIAAMDTLGPIVLVEPAPRSLARALESIGVPTAQLLQFEPERKSAALIEIEGAEVCLARRFFGTASAILAELAGGDGPPPGKPTFAMSEADAELINGVWPDAAAKVLPHIEHCPAEYSAAYGAARGAGESTESALTTADLARSWAMRHRRKLAVAWSALVAAAVLLAVAVDGYRARAQRSIESEIAALRDHGQVVLELQSEAERIRGNLEALTDIIADRMDPLEVLLTVSRLLPDDAYLRTIDGSGSEWRLDGYAGDAANLIPVFEASSSFENVRFVRATTRVRLGNENYEDFSLVFRYVPQTQ